MITLVIDASVAAKWVLPGGENLRHEALAVLGAYARGEVRFVVPDLFWIEMANILWRAARQGRLTRSGAAEALDALLSREFPTRPAGPLLPDALAIAMAFDRSVYDSVYVALATASRATLVTADERLANALAAHLPVKWLGGFSPA